MVETDTRNKRTNRTRPHEGNRTLTSDGTAGGHRAQHIVTHHHVYTSTYSSSGELSGKEEEKEKEPEEDEGEEEEENENAPIFR